MGHSQHPDEVQSDPRSGDVNVEYLDFHPFSRAQSKTPSPLRFRKLCFCYISYGNQPCYPHSYIHKNAKQSGILDFACKNCPNLQILQADYASLEIRLTEICKERGTKTSSLIRRFCTS